MRKLSAARPETLRAPHDNTPSPGNPPPPTRQPTGTSTTTLRPRQPSATHTATLRGQPPRTGRPGDPPEPPRRALTPHRPGSHPTTSKTPKGSVTRQLSVTHAKIFRGQHAKSPAPRDLPPRTRRSPVITAPGRRPRPSPRSTRRSSVVTARQPGHALLA